MAKNRWFIGPLEKFSHVNGNRSRTNLCFYGLCQLFSKFRYTVWEEIDFEISRSDLLLRLCDDWCKRQNLSLTFDFTR